MALSDGAWLREVGAQALLASRATNSIVSGRMDGREFQRSLLRLGVQSLPVIFATALFVGGMIVVQSAPLLTRWGAQSWLGWGAGFSIFREIGPVLTALMISGRAGSNNTAELGTLAVTDQVDGLRSLAIDPIDYLVAPRFCALILTTFLGTAFAMLLSLFGAAVVGQSLLHVHPLTFLNSLTSDLLGIGDVVHGMLKALVFGVAIGACTSNYGLSASGGPPGVGRAVQQAVVRSALLIFFLDAFVSVVAG